MKYQDIVPFYQKLNYKCKSGTVDDSNKCESEEHQQKKIKSAPVRIKRVSKTDLTIISKDIINDYEFLHDDFHKTKVIGYTLKNGLNIIYPLNSKSKNILPFEDLIDDLEGLPSVLINSVKQIDVADFESPENKHDEAEIVDGYLTLWNPSRLRITADNLGNTGLLVHELSHAFDGNPPEQFVSKGRSNKSNDFFIENEGMDSISGSIEWEEARKADNKEWVSSYAKSTGRYNEDFADSVTLYLLKRQTFSKKFPNRAKFIHNLLNKKTSKQNSSIIDQNSIPIKLNFRCPKGTVDDTFSCGKTPKKSNKSISVDITAPTQKALENFIQGDNENDPLPWDEDYNVKMGSKIYQIRLEGWYDDCLESRGYDDIDPSDYKDIIKNDFKNIVLDESGWDKSNSRDYIFGYIPDVKGTTYGVTYIGRPIKIKQNSTPLIKLSMKHPGNWSTADSLDTKIKKELASGIQDVIAILKSVKYFKEDPKEVALNEAYKKIAQDIFDTHVKLNYNCPADEKIGSGKGSCSGNTDNKSSDVIPDIPKDIVLGKDFDTIRAAINRKEFNLKTTKKEGMYETTYRIMISPKKIPQNWKSKINSIDSATTWYDPKYMKEVPFGNGKSTILKPINPEMEKVISLPSGKESGYLFRGMSYEEFENINKSGFIKTLAEYNFDFQGDMTFFADDKGTASNYASGFAPWQYGPTIDKPAVMIKIRDPGNHEPGTTEGEIGIKGKIPADLIEEVYFGHPVSMTQGYTEIINDKFNKSVYKGNSSSYKATVAWESRPYKNQKQNANCKQEEKVGSGPGSCSGGLKDSIQPAKVDLHPKLDPGDYNGLLKASKAIRNDKSEPDRVLRRMMAEEVERKFIRETKESVQASKEANDEFIKNSGNDTWNKLSSESQSAI